MPTCQDDMWAFYLGHREAILAAGIALCYTVIKFLSELEFILGGGIYG